MRRPLADQVANDDKPCRHSNPQLKRRDAGRASDKRRRLQQSEPCPHSSGGLVFVGLRIAEIDEHSVAHIFGNEALERAHDFSHAIMIGADHLAQLLWVEL